MRVFSCALVLLSACTSAPAETPQAANPYETLRAAYAARDAAMAASAYAPDAQLIYEYDATETYSGTAEIQSSFAALFEQIAPEDRMDLNFRIAESTEAGTEIRERGIYRLRIGGDFSSYGRFETLRDAGTGRFKADTGTNATLEAFEDLPGDVMFAADIEDLDRTYYGALAGRYMLDDGCTLVVTQSVVRLFVRNTCTQDWRGLYRVSGREWRSGATVLTDAMAVTYRFEGAEGAAPALLSITGAGSTMIASRADTYVREDITFTSADGTRLAGDLYRPAAPAGAATVLIHGSGPQDRNGFASIMAVLADALAANGHTVLTFDKRGAGASGGDGDRAGFGVLASDVAAAMDRVAAEPGVDSARIGVAGSSQAGWVAAKLIEQGASPAYVYLLGAAGTALTVPEQNLYNTQVRMRCSGLAEPDIALALSQQSAFFDFVTGKTDGAALDRITREARAVPALADWLFPASEEIDFTAGNWFTTLELGFDPLPVWRSYPGDARFVFAEHDDSTPTELAAARLADIAGPGKSVQVSVLEDAQHLGLKAGGLCDAELGTSTGFSAGLFPLLVPAGSP